MAVPRTVIEYLKKVVIGDLIVSGIGMWETKRTFW